jgi:hypothetical protein
LLWRASFQAEDDQIRPAGDLVLALDGKPYSADLVAVDPRTARERYRATLTERAALFAHGFTIVCEIVYVAIAARDGTITLGSFDLATGRSHFVARVVGSFGSVLRFARISIEVLSDEILVFVMQEGRCVVARFSDGEVARAGASHVDG